MPSNFEKPAPVKRLIPFLKLSKKIFLLSISNFMPPIIYLNATTNACAMCARMQQFSETDVSSTAAL